MSVYRPYHVSERYCSPLHTQVLVLHSKVLEVHTTSIPYAMTYAMTYGIPVAHSTSKCRGKTPGVSRHDHQI